MHRKSAAYANPNANTGPCGFIVCVHTHTHTQQSTVAQTYGVSYTYGPSNTHPTPETGWVRVGVGVGLRGLFVCGGFLFVVLPLPWGAQSSEM